VIVPQEYTIQKFYQYAGYPKYKRLTKVYEASCPICREGNSWGKKKRCYYLTDDNVICCHNCGWYGSTLNWIKQVTGLTSDEIFKEIKEGSFNQVDISNAKRDKEKIYTVTTLPTDSINLYDENQIEFYKDNKVVQDALDLLCSRRMITAINRPKSLWLSLTDRIHKNRIIIPFYDLAGNIIFYQSRELYDSHGKRPKYLGKVNGDRSLFNIDRVDAKTEYIFIFEGPIDAFFVQNGIAVAGIQEHSTKSLTTLQEKQLATFYLHNKIWVLDNQRVDKASYNKTSKLLSIGETVFIWPKEINKKYKDINDLCIATQRDGIDAEFFIKHSFNGIKGRLLLSSINR